MWGHNYYREYSNNTKSLIARLHLLEATVLIPPHNTDWQDLACQISQNVFTDFLFQLQTAEMSSHIFKMDEFFMLKLQLMFRFLRRDPLIL